MNAADSRPSSDTDNHLQHNAVHSAPEKSGTRESNAAAYRHDYFVPAIFAIVVGIIIVATFFDTRIDRHTAHKIPVVQNDAHTADAINHSSTDSGSRANTVIASDNTAIADSTELSASIAKPRSATQNARLERSSAAAVNDIPAPRAGIAAYPAYSGLASAALRVPRARQVEYGEMLAARRRARERFLQMHREHPLRIYDDRAPFPRRIEPERW